MIFYMYILMATMCTAKPTTPGYTYKHYKKPLSMHRNMILLTELVLHIKISWLCTNCKILNVHVKRVWYNVHSDWWCSGLYLHFRCHWSKVLKLDFSTGAFLKMFKVISKIPVTALMVFEMFWWWTLCLIYVNLAQLTHNNLGAFGKSGHNSKQNHHLDKGRSYWGLWFIFSQDKGVHLELLLWGSFILRFVLKALTFESRSFKYENS